MEYCKKFRSLPKDSCSHCNSAETIPTKKNYSEVFYRFDPGEESPISIGLQFSDHNGVERSISFPNRREYKLWKKENQIIKRKSLGTSSFTIRKGFMDSVNKQKDQEEAMDALMRKLKRDQEREELRVACEKTGNVNVMNAFRNMVIA